MEVTDASAYLALPYRVEIDWEQDEKGNAYYVARHPELDGCMAQGQTRGEALASLDEARELYIRALLKRGLEVPRPQSREPASR
jgi:predicted RNase H-like HicB family nuclease